MAYVAHTCVVLHPNPTMLRRCIQTLQHAVPQTRTEPILDAKDMWATGGPLRSPCACLLTSLAPVDLHPSWHVLCTPFFLQQQALASVQSPQALSQGTATSTNITLGTVHICRHLLQRCHCEHLTNRNC